jgi:hypothetical protein
MSPIIWVLEHAPRPSYFLVGFFFVFVVLPSIRRIDEGVAYSVAWSGTWGETPLFLIWTLGSFVVENVTVPSVLLSLWANVAIVAIFFVIGLFLWLQPDGHKNFTDGFHNIFVVPAFGYATAICMFLFLLTNYFLFLTIGILAIGVWGYFVRKDEIEGSMQQAAHVRNTGVRWIFGTKWVVKILDAIFLAAFLLILAEIFGQRLAFAFI